MHWPTLRSMILTLRILKSHSNRYRTKVCKGNREVICFESGTIGMAIREAAAHTFPDLEGFEVWFEHVCAGTLLPSNMRSDPEGLAQRLITLHSTCESQA